MDKTLLVLAAGMGSRYGGLKQLDPVGPSGETLLDYSVFDAARAGFSRVVFVIRQDFEEDFRERVARRFEGRMEVGLAFQRLNDLPGGHPVPQGRVKPWGTAYAVWCARDAVDTPFLAINADDFYGVGAFGAVGGFLDTASDCATTFCMAGYRLDATLSGGGSVSRGVCEVGEGGLLAGVTEFTAISREAGGIRDAATGRVFSGSEMVSMNFWGLTPGVFPLLGEMFEDFLASGGGRGTGEFYIPSAVGAMVASGAARVSVLPVGERWFGVTYRADREGVVDALSSLTQAGRYPAPLWGR